MKIGFKQLVEEAEREIETLTVEQAKALLRDDHVQFVDLRDVRELWREGKIPGAVHAPPAGGRLLPRSKYRRWDWSPYATLEADLASGRRVVARSRTWKDASEMSPPACAKKASIGLGNISV